ncbi:hypothetical protein BU23DRAFT_562950 [Bimuria novae-zelandiae CBS 107.79]|uniref:SsuA/THI5-like domain-containing protein n=1 Tax=Bimuria novae-zelandiae CBS 107.79 TaxID=1447943 RepID=A0A6A5VRJ4_9PLEO|nr:hypothetical protein BU23DRAFT_562950 [Bimuria novae-zelandiae CBS 107.79]
MRKPSRSQHPSSGSSTRPSPTPSKNFYNGSSTATLFSGGVANLASDSSFDLAANAETQGLKQYGNHKNIRLIYIITEVSYRLVARADAGIAQLSDRTAALSISSPHLSFSHNHSFPPDRQKPTPNAVPVRGKKKIGTISGTSAAVFIQRLLATAGISPDAYTTVSANVCMATPCAANTFPSLLAANIIDAFGVWEPSVELGIRAVGQDGVVVFQNGSLYREVYSLYTTTEKLADAQKRADIVAFVRALNQTRDVFTNPTPALYSFVADAIGMDEEVVKAVWSEHK